MKYLFRFFGAIQVWLYRISGGKIGGQMRGFKAVLLTTKGRKSGKTYVTPLGGFENKDGYVIVASNSGQRVNPGWYYNLKSNPHVTVQVLDQVIPVMAEELTGDARSQAWKQIVSTSPAYGGYEKRTKRVIPLILLHPDQSE